VKLNGFETCDYITEKREGWKREGLKDIEGWPAYIFRAYGRYPRDLIGDLDRITHSLKLHTEPYESLSEVSSRYLGIPVGGAYASVIYAVIPIYVRLEDILLEDSGNMKVSVRFHERVPLSDLKLGVILKTKLGVVDSFREYFNEIPKRKGSFLKSTKLIEREYENVANARLLLVHGGRLIREEWVNCETIVKKTNPRLVAHDLFDEDLEKLEEEILEARGKRFEEAICILLHLAGFNVEYFGSLEERLGRSKLDAFVFDPNSVRILVIGCTVGGLTPRDITNIAEKAKSFEKTLTSMNTDFQVVPVFFVRPAKDVIPQSVKSRAEEDKVVIIDENETLQILSDIKHGEPLRTLYSLLEERFIRYM